MTKKLALKPNFIPNCSDVFMDFSHEGVQFPDLNKLSRIFSGEFKKGQLTSIELYGIDRIIMIREAYDVSIHTYTGYYDEIELGGVYLASPIMKEIVTSINDFLACPDEEKITWLLKHEYGYLPNLGKNKICNPLTVKTVNIVEPNCYCSFSQKRLEAYDERTKVNKTPKGYPFKTKNAIKKDEETRWSKDLPQAIVQEIAGGKYHLVDGKHRLKAAKQNGQDNILVYCFS